MPETVHTSKKQKTREALHGDSTNEFRSPGEELLKQGNTQIITNGISFNEIRPLPAIEVPPLTHQDEGFRLKDPMNRSLHEHVESIMTELREGREKLLQWMRQEMQDLSTFNVVKRSHVDADKRRPQAEGSINVNAAGMQKVDQGGQTCEKSRVEKSQDHGEHKTTQPQDSTDVHDSSAGPRKNTGVTPSELQNEVSDITINGGSIVANKNVNGLDQGLESNANAKLGLLTKAGSSFHTAVLPAESKSTLFDSSFGVGSGDDVKGFEHLGGILESGVNIRESFDFNKASHDIQKDLDGLDRLRKTKNAPFDMGFDDESNGVGCRLENAASNRENSGFNKASGDIQSGSDRAVDTGFVAGFQSEDGVGDGKGEGVTNGRDVYGKMKIEIVGVDTVRAATVFVKDTKSDEESRQVDNMVGAHLAPPAPKENHTGATYSAQSMHPGDAQQQASISDRIECGIKRTYGSAMTLMGSALESKNDMSTACQENPSFADLATSSAMVMKNNLRVSAADKGKFGSLALHSGNRSSGMPSSAPAWSTSKNAINHTLHDSKVVHLEYASRSKLGDTILGSGRTTDFSGFDPVLSYTSQFKPRTEMLGAFQQEHGNASSMYFSSLCANNSGFLSSSNRGIGVQPSAPPSSSSALRPMMMGMPVHLAAHQDASNMHTFLGLGMNGVPAAANGVQVFPGLYLQGNQQHSQSSFRHTPSSTSPLTSQQDSPAVEEKAVLELNF